MAKAKNPLELRIADAAQVFATEIVAMIGNMSMSDLALLTAAARPSRGLSRRSAHAPSLAKKRRSWPLCGVAGCGRSYYPASGKSRLCYEHFLDSGGRHPSKKK